MTHASAYSKIIVTAGVERGYLLGREKLQRLAEAKNLRELITNLKGSPYENLFEPTLEISLENVQRVFKKELTRLYIKTLQLSPKELQGFLKEYISYLEIENLKTLLKAKNASLPYEKIAAMLNLSVEDIFDRKDLFTQAAKAENIKSSIKMFDNTPYASALSEALSLFEEERHAVFFDLVLDRVYYEHLFDSMKRLSKQHKKVVLPVLGPQLDVFKILTIIRSKFLGYPPQWVENAVTSRFYKLSFNDIHALNLIENATSALNVLKQTRYRKFLPLGETIETTLTDFEKAAKNQSLKLLDAMRIRDPFNISSPLSIMMLKEVEVQNLTKISAGIEHNWKPEEITSILF